MQQLGLGWLIVQLAQRDGTPQLVPVYLGLVGLARGAPIVFAGLAAAFIADRFDRRPLLLCVQVYWARVSAIPAWLVLAGSAGGCGRAGANQCAALSAERRTLQRQRELL
jgi:hypothetical protein